MSSKRLNISKFLKTIVFFCNGSKFFLFIGKYKVELYIFNFFGLYLTTSKIVFNSKLGVPKNKSSYVLQFLIL